MENIIEYIDWVDNLLLYLLKWFLIILGLLNINNILNIFKGKNGWEIKELGAVILIILASYMIVKEGSRSHEWHLYDEWYIGLVIGGSIFALGFDRFFEYLATLWGKKSNKSQDNPVDLNQETTKGLEDERG